MEKIINWVNKNWPELYYLVIMIPVISLMLISTS